MDKPVRVGIIGSQFISTIHAEALRPCAAAELFAAASPNESRVSAFAQRFDIPPLSFSIDGVEGERGLSGSAEAGHHSQLVPRNFNVDVLEIVLPRAPDCDALDRTLHR